ncbi:MAG: glucose PTS transporter subunit EIIB, partial [Enterobacteriaceae bacterium]
DVKTPGRSGSAVAVVTKKEYQAAKAMGAEKGEQVDAMIAALGGQDNIVDVDACITRLRITVKDGSLVKDNDFWVQNLQAKGLVKVGDTGIQIIYGAQAAGYKALINEKLARE